MAVSIGCLAECFEQSKTLSTVDVALGHQRKGDVELGRRELADFLVGAGFLGTELIAREANDGQVVVCFVEGLKTCVLRSGAASAGDVDDHPAGPAEAS